MRSGLGLLMAALALGGPAPAQELASLFPAHAQGQASRLIEALDRAVKGAEAKRLEAWKAQKAAEAEAVRDFALIAASQGGKGPWAAPDGSVKAADASAAFPDVLARAKAVARSLASGEDGSAEFIEAREKAARSLASLIRSSGLSAKSASTLGRRLGMKAQAGRLLPEIVEISDLLRASGKAGCIEAAVDSARGSAEGIALSLIDAKARISALAPEAAAPLARLEVTSRAYRTWLEAFPPAAYPGDALPAPDVQTVSAAEGMAALAGLGSSRLRALVEAMAQGDGREAAAAHAAAVTAETWLRSPEAKRRSLAATFGLAESTMADFCFALASTENSRDTPPAVDAMASLRTLNSLAAAMQGGAIRTGRRGGEPALLLLERRELADLAQREPRYASLYAEASERIDAIYFQAAEDAAARIESSPSLRAAAARALCSTPTSVSVRAVDIAGGGNEAGRSLAFEAVATDSSGTSVSLPVSADEGGRFYAYAFARAAGLESPRSDPEALLAQYAQRIVSAYDPSGCGGGLGIDDYPRSASAKRLDSVELEVEMLGGWRP